MKANYRIEGIDCVNCALKLQGVIQQQEGVNEVMLNFIMGKMSLDVESEEVLEKVLKVIKKTEPDCEVTKI